MRQTFGYRTRTEAAVAMRAEGLTVRQIADRFGVTQGAINGLIYAYSKRLALHKPRQPYNHAAAIREHRPTISPARRVLNLQLTDEEFAEVIRAARAVGLTPSAYATQALRNALGGCPD